MIGTTTHKLKWILASGLIAPVAFAGNTAGELAKRCLPASAKEASIYSSDFKWGYSIAESDQRFIEIYDSPKRLPLRAYYDPRSKSLKLPYEKERGGHIVITPTFFQTVARHVEQSLQAKYANAVFFPDMGHSHLLIPESSMAKKYGAYPNEKMSMLYRDLFKDPTVKFAYHAAEQLTMLDQDGKLLNDPEVVWRHKFRNIVGANSVNSTVQTLQNPESRANTLNGVSGYYWWGGGFNFSAHKKGCVEYVQNGKKMYFDISMYDLVSDPAVIQAD